MTDERDVLDNACAVDVPRVKLGRRFIPGWCARARFEGQELLLEVPDWPGVEACECCEWFRGASASHVVCAAPGAGLEGRGLSLEVDVYRETGQKRRTFMAPGAGVGTGVRALMTLHAPQKIEVVDVKFVSGEPNALKLEPDAFMERWRNYWNGDAWVKKEAGAPLHDWNKWGRELEFLSASDPGGLPPEGGWPAVLDLPEGRYEMRIVEVRWRSGRRSEPELEWVFRVVAGRLRGRRVLWRSPVRNKALLRRFQRAAARVRRCPLSEIPSPEEEGFGTMLESLAGVTVSVEVRRRNEFTNLEVKRRLGR